MPRVEDTRVTESALTIRDDVRSRRCAKHTMRPIATDVAWSAHVCLSVTNVGHTKTAEPIEMLFGVWTLLRPPNHVLVGSPDRPSNEAVFGGGGCTGPAISGRAVGILNLIR